MLVPQRNYQSPAYRYGFQGQEKDPETGKEAFELRLWDGRIGRWLTTDPYGQHFSPYLGMGNNPISSIDPDGGSDDEIYNPIYGLDGKFLGTDDLGLQGDKIVMDERHFKQGMSHNEAMAYNVDFANMNSFDLAKMNEHFAGLPSRPDWDGKITLAEANEWFKNGHGKSLFVDLNKIDLSGLGSLGEKYVGQIKSYNLPLVSHSLNDILVYGHLTLKRYPNNQVRAYSDNYDFEMHDSGNPKYFIRNFQTVLGRAVAGPGTPYEINIFGSKTLNRTFTTWLFNR